MKHGRPRLPRRETSGRDPFEVFILCCGVLSGVPIVLGVTQPNSVALLLDPTLVTIWGWMLTIGCAVAIVGLFWPGLLATGLLTEQCGLVAVSAGVGIYTYALASNPAGPSVLALAIIGGFALACMWRVRQIQLWIRQTVLLTRVQQETDRRMSSP